MRPNKCRSAGHQQARLTFETRVAAAAMDFAPKFARRYRKDPEGSTLTVISLGRSWSFRHRRRQAKRLSARLTLSFRFDNRPGPRAAQTLAASSQSPLCKY